MTLPEEHIKALAELCASEHISPAEAIRRAGDALIEERRADRAEAVIQRTFGAWKHLRIDTDTHLAELRSEWDRELDR